MTTRWTLEDQVTSDTYTFEINPATAKIPSISKKINYENTSAPSGKVIIFEGRDEVQKGSFGGKILTQQQYENLEEWANKRHQLLLTDDLNRSFWIYITSLDITRLRRAGNAWLHEYTLEFTVLDWP